MDEAENGSDAALAGLAMYLPDADIEDRLRLLNAWCNLARECLARRSRFFSIAAKTYHGRACIYQTGSPEEVAHLHRELWQGLWDQATREMEPKQTYTIRLEERDVPANYYGRRDSYAREVTATVKVETV